MSCILNLEREFFKVAKDLEKKSEVKPLFMKKITEHSEEWIDDKLRLNFIGLED